mgnify:CR=1 FL=1
MVVQRNTMAIQGNTMVIQGYIMVIQNIKLQCVSVILGWKHEHDELKTVPWVSANGFSTTWPRPNEAQKSL